MKRFAVFSSLAGLLVLSACSTASGPTNRPTTADTTSRASPVATSHPFELDGRVASVGNGVLGMGGHTLTISRDGAPATELHVADRTRVTLDDRPAKLTDLRPGDDVRALFDFDKDKPVAIEIKAKPHR